MHDLLMPRASIPAARVSYSSHLFRAACEDIRTWLRRQTAYGGVLAASVFFSAAFLAWLIRAGEVSFTGLLLSGLAALLFLAAGIFAMHWGYLTPKRLCAAKQHQLEAERHQFMLAMDKEKQALQLAQAERDV